MKTCYGLVGAGGYGREVMPMLKQLLKDEILSSHAELFFVVENEVLDTLHSNINGYPVVSMSDFIKLDSNKYFNIAIGDSKVRERIANDCISSNMTPFSITSSNSVILDENTIGKGCILSPFATITSNVKIGDFFHANLYSYVGHDCVIGDYVTFAPNVHCNGYIVIEDHAYIGTGAIIKPGTREKPTIIGRNSIVGMGAIVNKNVPPFTTVFGNPAQQIKK